VHRRAKDKPPACILSGNGQCLILKFGYGWSATAANVKTRKFDFCDRSSPEWLPALSHGLASGDSEITELITFHLEECAALVVPIQPNTKDRPNNMQEA